uniref:Uncharacterized protein n=1 Tax=Branchiostoma floridae TaxID=7739 RepID=C3YC66_BRAFL|eukprot:XP_002606088.1 hypothetical protein BRAFLDRAFT_87998 [Branchiostoma floridae]
MDKYVVKNLPEIVDIKGAVYKLGSCEKILIQRDPYNAHKKSSYRNKQKFEVDRPAVIVSIDKETVENAESVHGLCREAWNDVGRVNVAWGQDSTLRIVPVGPDEFYKPKAVAVVLSDVPTTDHKERPYLYADDDSRGSGVFGNEETKQVTCYANDWEKTYRYVFTTPVSSTPEGTVCPEQRKVTQATETVSDISDGSTSFRAALTTTRTVSSSPDDPKTGTHATENSKTKTTEGILNLTSTRTNLKMTVPSGNDGSPHVAIIITLSVVGAIFVAVLLLAYFVRDKQAGQAAVACGAATHDVASLNHWVIVRATGHVVTVNANQNVTDPNFSDEATYENMKGDDEENSELPDDYHTYVQIPDIYFNRKNTRPASLHLCRALKDDSNKPRNASARPLSYPLALQAPPPFNQDGGDDIDSATSQLYASVAGTAFLSSATQMTANIRSYGMVAEGTRTARNRALIGKYLYGKTKEVSEAGEQVMALYHIPHM